MFTCKASVTINRCLSWHFSYRFSTRQHYMCKLPARTWTMKRLPGRQESRWRSHVFYGPYLQKQCSWWFSALHCLYSSCRTIRLKLTVDRNRTSQHDSNMILLAICLQNTVQLNPNCVSNFCPLWSFSLAFSILLFFFFFPPSSRYRGSLHGKGEESCLPAGSRRRDVCQF